MAVYDAQSLLSLVELRKGFIFMFLQTPTTFFEVMKAFGMWYVLLWAIFRLFIRPFARKYSKLTHGAVLVTGCDYGFGRNIALHLHKRGATVFAGCLNEAAAEKLVAAVPPESRSRMRAVVMDVTSQRDVDAVRNQVEKAAKAGLPLNAVINNAGVSAFGWAEMIPTDRLRLPVAIFFFF